MVIERARELVDQLSDNDITEQIAKIETKSGGSVKGAAKKVRHYDEVDLGQLSLFDTSTDEDVLKELREADIQNMTPLDAMNTLFRLQSRLKNRWQAD